MSTPQEESPSVTKIKGLCKRFLDTCDFTIYDELAPAILKVGQSTHPLSFECFEANALYTRLLTAQVFIETVMHKKPFAHLKSKNELLDELTRTQNNFSASAPLSTSWRALGLTATLMATFKLSDEEKQRMHLFMNDIQKSISLRLLDILKDRPAGSGVFIPPMRPVRTGGSA